MLERMAATNPEPLMLRVSALFSGSNSCFQYKWQGIDGPRTRFINSKMQMRMRSSGIPGIADQGCGISHINRLAEIHYLAIKVSIILRIPNRGPWQNHLPTQPVVSYASYFTI